MFLTAVPLTAHPDTQPGSVPGVVCSLAWQDAGHWSASFIVDALPQSLRLPAPVKRARADGLWQRTCFELFVFDEDSGSYMEFNFSPSGEWAAYAFDGYRTGMRPLDVKAPTITSSDPDQFRSGMEERLADIGLDQEVIEGLLDAPTPDMPATATRYALSAMLEDDAFDTTGRWWLGISAVIEEADSTRSYWALAHGPGEPDFHNPDCFALEVPAPSAP